MFPENYVDNSPEARYKRLIGDAWEKVVFMGQMVGVGSRGLAGHNDRYYVIEGNLGLKVTWGDFSSNQVHYPMLFDPREEYGKIVKIYDPVYVLHERFDADCDYKKSRELLEALDFDGFCKKYDYKFDKDRLGPYYAQFIIDKCWAKIENGVLYEKDPRSGKFVEY